MPHSVSSSPQSDDLTSGPVLSQPALARPLFKHRTSPADTDAFSRKVSFVQGMHQHQKSPARSSSCSAASEEYGIYSTGPTSFRRRSNLTMKHRLTEQIHNRLTTKAKLTQARRSSCAKDLLGYKQLPTSEDSCSDEEIDQTATQGDYFENADSAVWELDVCSNIKSYLQVVIESTAYQAVTICTIIFNAAVIGFETDYPEMPIWIPVEHLFLVMFTVELLLRLITQGPQKFFCGHTKAPEVERKAAERRSELRTSELRTGEMRTSERRTSELRKRLTTAVMKQDSEKEPGTARRKPVSNDMEAMITLAWNFFDFLIVSLGWINTTSAMFGISAHGGGEVTVFRAIRLLRILRVLRVMRVLRFLKQLYLLAYGFMEGTMAVFWVAVLATCCCYLFSIVLVKGYGRPEDNDPHKDFFEVHFGSVSRTMFTLFQLLASPSIGEFRDVIFEHPPLVAFLLFWVVFGSFGVSGLLTGVITESIIDKNQARVEEQRQEREAKHRLLEEQTALLFDEIVETKDEDQLEEEGGEICLTIQDLVDHKEHISFLFQAAGVAFPAYDFEGMCAAMDFNDSGKINRSEFVHGILELCEDVRPMSIMELHSHVSKVNIKCVAIHSDIEELGGFIYPQTHARRHRSRRSMKEEEIEHLSQAKRSFLRRNTENERDTDVTRRLNHNEALIGQLTQTIETLVKEVEALDHDRDADTARNAHPGRSDMMRTPGSTPRSGAMHVLAESARFGQDIAVGKCADGQSEQQQSAEQVAASPLDQQQSTGSVFAPGAAAAAAAAAATLTAVPTLAPRVDSRSASTAETASSVGLAGSASSGPRIDKKCIEFLPTSVGSAVHPRSNSY